MLLAQSVGEKSILAGIYHGRRTAHVDFEIAQIGMIANYALMDPTGASLPVVPRFGEYRREAEVTVFFRPHFRQFGQIQILFARS